MKSIFSNMYDDWESPADKVTVKSEDYKNAEQVYCQKYGELEALLDKDNKKLLEQIVDWHSDMNDMLCKEYYVQGIALGIRMVIDALVITSDE